MSNKGEASLPKVPLLGAQNAREFGAIVRRSSPVGRVFYAPCLPCLPRLDDSLSQ